MQKSLWRYCEGGTKQRALCTEEESTSATVTIKSAFLIAVIKTKEKRGTTTMGMPNVFVQTNIGDKCKSMGWRCDLLV